MQISMISKTTLLMLICLIPFCGYASMRIEAFGLSYHPFISVTFNVDICYVDQYSKGLQLINQEIRDKKKISLEKLRSQHQHEFSDIMRSYACSYQAVLLGVTKLPAIVFNRKDVIYGEKNIKDAISIYKNDEARKND